MFGVWAAAALACVLGALAAPSAGPHSSTGQEAVDLLRVVSTSALAITLLLGPGVLWRLGGGRRHSIAFLPLPGLAILAAVGCLAWVLGGSVDPKVTCFASFGPLLGLMLGGLIGAGQEDVFEPEEQRALLITALALGVAIARSLWSLGPVGELYEGTISRTFVPEGRPDSRISFIIAQLVANHRGPYSPDATYLFSPYNFSSRGPVPGLASTPIVLLSGAHPQLGAPEQPWQPFDGQGFMAYRIAMITFSCTIFLSLWELVRRIGGFRAARFALLLGVSTPFLIADLWYTWPKLLAASFVLLGGIFIVERKSFRSGLMVGVGYLMHPSALLGLLTLGPLSLWPLRGANWKRPRLLSAIALLAGTAVSMVAWRIANAGHFLQDQFFEYVLEAYPDYHPPIGPWVEFRLHSLANTIVPLFLPVFDAHNVSTNTFGGVSPGVVHFFFQYWTGVPFGLGIFFFPFLLVSLWRAGKRWPWPVFATVLLPLILFTIYWGASSSGMLREGLQAWVLVLVAVVALQQAGAGFPWLRSVPIRVVLVLRAVEVFAVAVGATLGTHHFLLASGAFRLNDAVALAAICAFSLGMVIAIWRETGRAVSTSRDQPAETPISAG